MAKLLNRWSRRSNQEIFVFVHLPRCAGTFLLRSFAWLGRRKIVVSHSPDSKRQAQQFVASEIEARNLNVEEIELVAGHDTYFGVHDFSPHRPFYFTFLRDPVDRYLSNVRFLQDAAQNPKSEVHTFAKQAMMEDGRMRSLEEIVQQGRMANMVTHYLAAAVEPDLDTGRWHHRDPEELVRLAKLAIDQFQFIGFFDQLEQDAQFICQRMRVPLKKRPVNRTKSKFETPVSSSLRDKISQLNLLDGEVVQYARLQRLGSQ